MKVENKFSLKKRDNFVKEDNEEREVLERETDAAILESKKIDFLKPYYEEHNLYANSSWNWKRKAAENRQLFKNSSAYFEEDLNLTENVSKERLVDVISSANKILH